MCGIFGIQNPQGGITPELVARSTDLLSHRGPDDSGLYINAQATAGLGHRRLSIIDLSRQGRQPMTNEARNLFLTFNGEIYNFQALRRELESEGHVFQSRTDSEVVLHAYEAWGAGCLQRFRGMFAFAIWDSCHNRLFAARDRLGIKPFYYYVRGGLLAFASELRALVALPGFQREVAPRAVADYLTYGYIPPPGAIWKDTFKLPAGCYLEAPLGAPPAVQTYWDVDLTPDESRSEMEWLEGLDRLLEESVKLRLISDVPLGAFLSGGIDSSTVVSHMGEQVKTFTIGFREASQNESVLARLLAARYRTVHRERVVVPEDAMAELGRMVDIFDEPFADTSGVPMAFLSRMSRKFVKVVLSGDGGDELFGGYSRYHRLRQTRVLNGRFITRGLAQLYRNMLPPWRTESTYLSKVALSPFDAYLEEMGCFPPDGTLRILAHNHKKALDGYNPREHMISCLERAREKGWDWLSQMRYCDLKMYLPEDILTKVDRVTMSVALEARVPLLDHELVQYAARIPSRLLISGPLFNPELKAILRRHARPRLPREHMDAPKRGFGLPLAQWLRNELREMVLSLEQSEAPLNRDEVREVIGYHLQGTRDFTIKLWNLLILDRWWRRWMH